MKFNLFANKDKEIQSLTADVECLTKTNQELETKVASIKDATELQVDRDNLFNELQALKEKQVNHEKELLTLKESHELTITQFKSEYEGKLTKKETQIGELTKNVETLKESHKQEIETIKSTQAQEVVDEATRIVSEQGVNTPNVETTNNLTESTDTSKPCGFRVVSHLQKK